MTGDDLAAWVDSLFPGMTFAQLGDATVATSTHAGAPVACTLGFSALDTGLRLEAEPDVRVGCEMAVRGDVDKLTLSSTLLRAADELAALGAPVQPGVLLEGIAYGKARHGWLREPQFFERGTPHLREEGLLVLLIELVLLTDDEFEIARNQGTDVLQRRLRRRGTDLADWMRD